ncbi:hypothetical protein [uncultured Jannaschia sp.]|uniref:hypothetical protein n=1 Tax=uncultured Jannaschia sp. TaxID=293347 RepID=UPI00262C2069|nr:hypothetical protein [uncultured Jannaschia sp.]
MAGTILFLAGTSLVVFVFYDFLRTTISMAGLGPLSFRITYALWRLAGRLVPRLERRFGLGLRNLIGPLILTAIAFAWIILHLIGYTAMFAAGRSLAKTETGAEASLLETVAFVGASLSTLGASIVEPTNGWWDNLSMIAAVNGMVVLTLSVSFILTILQITTAARAFALRVHTLTDTEPDDPSRQLERIAPLGPEFCSLVTQVTASPLPGVFVPDDPAMDFPAAIVRVCRILDRAEDEAARGRIPRGRTAELERAATRLGRLALRRPEPTLAAARRWAEDHDLRR